jgi:surface protein
MAKNNNLTDLLADIADAIREKKGTSGPINPQDFSSEIASIETGGGNTPMWTGHADAEGLRAIGWTDEDIAYYQEHGVNWNAEDDEYHKVSDDNKALYGVLTADNITSYRARIVYLPKIDTSRKTSMSKMFYNCTSLVSIPQLDTQNVTNMNNMFQSCTSLVSIPQLDTQNVTNMSYMFNYCYSLVSIPQLDTQNVTNMSYMFDYCYSLTNAYLKNVKLAYQLNSAALLSKESLLYLINNEAATSAITIKLAGYAYTRLANDADIVAALAAHPNISISQ